MKLTARSIRHGLTVAAIAATAAALPASALAASAQAGHAARGVASCKSFNTQIWLGLGNIRSNAYPLEFTNIGRQTCVFFGYPGVSAVRRSGAQIGRPASHAGRGQFVLLRPGSTAHVLVRITAARSVSGCNPRPGAFLKVFAPGQHSATIIPSFTFTACTNRSVLMVNAMHPGTGVPGFSRA